MNKARRKDIAKLVEKIQSLQGDMELLLEELESIRDEEQEAFDNIPENMYGSERYEKAEAAVENLESAFDAFEEAKDAMDDIMSYLEEASE
jgi:seryl-tRNA synthetase